jgi:hypothetical protein
MLALVYTALGISTRFPPPSENGYIPSIKLTKDAVCGAKSLVPTASLVADVYQYLSAADTFPQAGLFKPYVHDNCCAHSRVSQYPTSPLA